MVVTGKEKEGVYLGHFSGWHTLIYSLGSDIAANPIAELTCLATDEHEGQIQLLTHYTFYRTFKCLGVTVIMGLELLPLAMENY